MLTSRLESPVLSIQLGLYLLWRESLSIFPNTVYRSYREAMQICQHYHITNGKSFSQIRFRHMVWAFAFLFCNITYQNYCFFFLSFFLSILSHYILLITFTQLLSQGIGQINGVVSKWLFCIYALPQALIQNNEQKGALCGNVTQLFLVCK